MFKPRLYIIIILNMLALSSFAQRGKVERRLELGFDLRNDFFLGNQYFPTARLGVGINNQKNSLGIILYNNLQTFKYWGVGAKYMRYVDVSQNRMKLGLGIESSIMKGGFIYNEVLHFDGAVPYLYNKYCVSANLCVEAGYKLGTLNMVSVYGG